MANTQSYTNSEDRAREQGPHGVTNGGVARSEWDNLVLHPRNLLSIHDNTVRGNGPVRVSAIREVQKTHGNHAVQRAIQRSLPVQRNLLDDATSWAGDNMFRNPLDTFGIAHGLNQVFGEQHEVNQAGQVTNEHAPSMFYQGLRSAENAVTGGVHSAASSVADVPVLGSIANWGADFIGNRAQQATGFLAGAGDFVGGITNMVDNPMQTMGAFRTMAENNLMLPGFLNPFRMAHAAQDVITGEGDLGDRVSGAAHQWLDPTESMNQSLAFGANMVGGIVRPYSQSISEGRGNEAMGRLGFDILSNMTGGGEARAAGEGAAAARTAATVGREGELASDVARGMHAPTPGGSAISAPRAPQPVMQMPAIDAAAMHPNMPQPPRWQAGPVGTPPVSNPVREMPSITAGQAASGQIPRDWGTYAVGRGRMPGQVGEMPVVSANPGMREPVGFGNNAGAVSPRSSAPVGPSISPVDPLAQTAAIPGEVNPFGRTVEAPNPFGRTAEAPNPFGRTIEAPNPFAQTGHQPVHTPTIPGGQSRTYPGTGYPPTTEMPLAGPSERPTLPGIGAAETPQPPWDPNEIAAAHEGARVPVHQDPYSGSFLPGHEPGRLLGGTNRLPDFISGLMDAGEFDAMREILGGHGLDMGEYLRSIGRME